MFEGKLIGKVATTKKGEHGFGYDPIFIPNEYSSSLAELGEEIKNKISHRKKAISKMVDFRTAKIQQINTPVSKQP